MTNGFQAFKQSSFEITRRTVQAEAIPTFGNRTTHRRRLTRPRARGSELPGASHNSSPPPRAPSRNLYNQCTDPAQEAVEHPRAQSTRW